MPAALERRTCDKPVTPRRAHDDFVFTSKFVAGCGWDRE
jgi:hypothetical protein